MPVIFVPSHHSSPENGNILPYQYPLNFPGNIPFKGREGGLVVATICASQKAVDKILVTREDNFHGYSLRLDFQTLNTEIGDDEVREGNWDEMWADPSRKNFGEGYTTSHSSISLVNKSDVYASSISALFEVLGNLPIIPVLQGILFHPMRADTLEISNVGRDISNIDGDGRKYGEQERLQKKYPFGILSYPKRIWPEFYHAYTGESLLRVSHHPDHDNDPHRNAFFGDPRFGEVKEEDTIETIIKKFQKNLMPILSEKLEEVNGRKIEIVRV